MKKNDKSLENNGKTPLTLVAKIVCWLCGFSSPLLGYAIYFALYDVARDKGAYFRGGARTSLICMLISLITVVILEMNGIDIIKGW